MEEANLSGVHLYNAYLLGSELLQTLYDLILS